VTAAISLDERRARNAAWQKVADPKPPIPCQMFDADCPGACDFPLVMACYLVEYGATMPDDTPEPLLQFFVYAHLRDDLKPISKVFSDLAHDLVVALPRNPERTVCLRKLMESKDCAVRALLYK
jgi:hypothetical protein